MTEIAQISAQEGERLFEKLLNKAMVEALGRLVDKARSGEIPTAVRPKQFWNTIRRIPTDGPTEGPSRL